MFTRAIWRTLVRFPTLDSGASHSQDHISVLAGSSTANVDSARGNLAGTFVNAFVNAGFGNDKLMVEADEGNSWIYKNKDHGTWDQSHLLSLADIFFLLGMMSAAASLGLSLLWDTDLGLSHVDKYTYSAEEYIKAGALLATGILNTSIRSENDTAKALLGEYVENKSVPLKTGAIVGLGLAYAGSHRRDLAELLLPLVADDTIGMEIASLSALAVGFIFVGSEDGEASSTILQTLMEREDKQLEEKWARFMGLGLALLYLGTPLFSPSFTFRRKTIECTSVSQVNRQQILTMRRSRRSRLFHTKYRSRSRFLSRCAPSLARATS